MSGSHLSSPSPVEAHGERDDLVGALVQLPIDFQRGATRAWSHTRIADLPECASTAAITAALLAVLARYAQQSELALDVYVGGSPQHTARLRLSLDDTQSFAALSERVSDALGVPPSAQVEGDANVALTFVRDGVRLDAGALPSARELCFVVLEAGARRSLHGTFDGALFRRETVERIGASLGLLLAAAADDAEQALWALPVISQREASALAGFSYGGASGRTDVPVHERFSALAREQPDAPAVRFRDHTLSYAALDARAERLAHQLVALGVRPESMVAVCLAPCLEVLVTMLAIFKAGAVYVPLDPTHPSALRQSILDEVEPAVVVSDGSLRETLPGRARLLDLARGLQGAPVLPISALPGVSLEQPCYVLYTSGSTGRPKGVVASHQNLAHYLGVARERYGFGPSDVFASLARYTFSISFFELLSPLACGGSVRLFERDDVLDPARLSKGLDAVTVLHAGPSLLGALFRHLRAHPSAPQTFARLRHASSGGDVVPPELLEEMKRRFTEAEIFVIYGCTEISCMGLTQRISRAETVVRTLVGRPFPDVSVRVLDARGHRVPPGAVGEVYIAGKGVARRYLARPELTSERFVSIDGQRFYRTGDLARLSPDGALELVGRRDFQVQVRGIRVELLGIEQTIRELGLAAQCAVVAVTHDALDARLVAFVVEPRERDSGSFRRALAARLPEYMLPQSVVVLDALPLTANGKLDRKRLVERAEEAPRSGGMKVLPRTAQERAVAACFAEVLGREPVGLDDDFFDLGGHSLSAVLLLEALSNRLGLRVSPSILFEHTTVRALARALSDGATVEPRPILLSQDAAPPALFLLLGVHVYRELARQLEGQYAVYGVYASSELVLLDDPTNAPSVEDLAREYVTLIRREQPLGPYRIGGLSFGGIVAYEVAQQLKEAGEQVELLALFDAVMPERRVDQVLRLAALPGRALLGQLVERLRRPARASALAAFAKHGDDPSFSALEERRQAAYRSAAQGYRQAVRPYHGEVLLLAAGERLAGTLADPLCGFSRLCPSLAAHTLASSHLGLLEAPHAAVIAALLSQALRRSGGRRCLVPDPMLAPVDQVA